jgi:hypothetical protein
MKDLVIVTWDDPNSSAVEVITEENIDQHHVPEVMETVGWLVKEDERGVSVCNELYYETGKPRWRGHTFIVRSLIKSIQRVKHGSQPRKATRKSANRSSKTEQTSAPDGKPAAGTE